MIVGKSGSGKSTLLNIASGLDSCSSGHVEIFDKNINLDKGKYLSYLHREYISFLHQDYLLILDETVIYNISLPLIIKGNKVDYAYKKSKEALHKFGFDDKFAYRICKDLSGGEKQRVALIRAIISGPKIIFMDEPTGALDSKNKTAIMSIIKKISRNVLIFFVTHDKQLVNEYADRIIVLKDGEIDKDVSIHSGNDLHVVLESKYKNKNYFENYEIKNHLKKKWKRNILRFISLVFTFTSLLLVIGFNYGASRAINKESNNLLDIGVNTLSKEEKRQETDSPISLIKTSRPNAEETQKFLTNKNYYTFGYNYSYLLSNINKFEIEGTSVDNALFSPVYNFSSDYVNTSLLSKGFFPKNENEIVINSIFYEKLSNTIKIPPIGKYVKIKWVKECIYWINKDEYIPDYFVLEKDFKIVGVVDEFKFMNSPKIYYSYQWLDSYLSSIYLNNLSIYFKRDYSWKERIVNALDNDDITSFSSYLFLNDLNKIDDLTNDIQNNDKLFLSNLSFSIKSTILDVISVMGLGLNIIVGLIILGLIILLIISSISNYIQDKRRIAIYLSLGCLNSTVENIYLGENILIGILSLILSIGFSYLFSFLINSLINHLLAVKDIIYIPLFNFGNGSLFVPIILILPVLVICLITTLIPIKYAESKSIKEEIKNND